MPGSQTVQGESVNDDPPLGLGISTRQRTDSHEMSYNEQTIEISPNERYACLSTLLGKGTYKTVYKAIDREEGYEVAWNSMEVNHKSINQQVMSHEISILKAVRHANIISFYDAWYFSHRFVFVTELMTSGTLREYIKKLSLPNLKVVKRWSRQILKGLAYLHSHDPPIIHRDIKCDNIFINGAHGEVKIGDMGTAKMKMGKNYTIIGTPEFMAPEMYENEGYNEKVDIYAFGMCLLEMVTGDYPYGECANAAQIYKKVSSGVKPASISKVQNEEVKSIIDNCLGNENNRMSAQDILEHDFFAVEPDIVLINADPGNIHLTLQVVFKGMDKLSVKFDFNIETDTAEQVVREMIEEQVLPERYQHHITKEINRILRDLDKLTTSKDQNTTDSIWRRENDIRSELERTQSELSWINGCIVDMESKCDGFKNRVLNADRRYREVLQSMKDLKESKEIPSEYLDRLKKNIRSSHGLRIDTNPEYNQIESELASTTIEDVSDKRLEAIDDNISTPLTATSLSRELLVSKILEEYSNETDIEVFVKDCAMASHRNVEKAIEWAKKLKDQDIMTVGDLRDLHDEDWTGIGLTVFALRSLKNMLKGKKSSSSVTPLNSIQNSARVSPTS